jgi:hypothetical protein
MVGVADRSDQQRLAAEIDLQRRRQRRSTI